MRTTLMGVPPERAAALLDLLAETGWVRTVEVRTECGSTNDVARERADKSELPLLVVAEKQTRGRGRRGARWLDLPGACALMSLAWHPEGMPASLMPLVGLAGAVAAARAARRYGVPARVKWPNDIWAHDRKLGGVLAESIVSGPHVSLAILGIGVNVRAAPQTSDLPQGAVVATSMAELAPGATLDPYVCVGAIVAGIPELVDDRGWPRAGAVIAAARELDALLGRRVAVSAQSSEVTGTAADIDPRGLLVLTLDDGSRVAIDDPSATVRLT